ncbi:RraA family protein [Aliihoeflea sp. PC F10.4]
MNLTDVQFLADCEKIATSTWSDALDGLDIDGVVEGIVKRGGTGRFAAFAVTARHIVGRKDDFASADFTVGRLVDATGPGRVLVVDAGGADISTFGGIASGAAAARGATAVLIDGACRDLDEIEETSLWLASRHVTPRTGKRRLKLAAMGQPVTLGGISVREGDLVVGDETGIVVVPRARMEEVLAAARAALETDRQVEKGIADGLSFADAAAAAGYIPR